VFVLVLSLLRDCFVKYILIIVPDFLWQFKCSF